MTIYCGEGILKNIRWENYKFLNQVKGSWAEPKRGTTLTG